jgi:hypothetical protein
MGIENYPTPIKPCKQWCCNRSCRNNHYKHYKFACPLLNKCGIRTLNLRSAKRCSSAVNPPCRYTFCYPLRAFLSVGIEASTQTLLQKGRPFIMCSQQTRPVPTLQRPYDLVRPVGPTKKNEKIERFARVLRGVSAIRRSRGRATKTTRAVDCTLEMRQLGWAHFASVPKKSVSLQGCTP